MRDGISDGSSAGRSGQASDPGAAYGPFPGLEALQVIRARMTLHRRPPDRNDPSSVQDSRYPMHGIGSRCA